MLEQREQDREKDKKKMILILFFNNNFQNYLKRMPFKLDMTMFTSPGLITKYCGVNVVYVDLRNLILFTLKKKKS